MPKPRDPHPEGIPLACGPATPVRLPPLDPSRSPPRTSPDTPPSDTLAGVRPQHRSALAAALAAALAPALAAAPKAPAPMSHDDFLERYAKTYRFRLGYPRSAQVPPEGDVVLFLRSPPRDFAQDLYQLDVVSGEAKVLLTAADLLGGEDETLSAEEKARRERQRLAAKGIASFSLSRDGRRVLVPLSGRLWVLDRATGQHRELPEAPGYPLDTRFTPDGRRVACVRDDEVWTYDLDGDEGWVQRTEGAGGDVTHGTAEFVAQEEMSRYEGFWFSPDGETLLFQRTDTSKMATWTIADPAHPETPADTWPYPPAGGVNATVTLGLVRLGSTETTWVDWDRERYEYLARVDFSRHGPLTILVQDRRQREQVLLEVDTTTGATRPLVAERDEAWVEIDSACPVWLPGGERFLWSREVPAGRRLELRDRAGKLVRVLVDAATGYRALSHLFPDRAAVAVRGGDDPTQSQIFVASTADEPSPARRITTTDGVHWGTSAGEAPVFVATLNPAEGEPEVVVLDAQGQRQATLPHVAEADGVERHVEYVTVGQDPVHHAALVRPADFDPGKRYPVIASVYGGPGATTVHRMSRAFLFSQWMADQGYVVVHLDVRGTPYRDRAWRTAIRGDLSKVPLEDTVRILRDLAARFPELDPARVGIYGWSFGGYLTAHAVMRHPEMFRAGVAGAPVADWESYDTHYTERFMGLPAENAEGYKAAAVQTWAKDLERPLLIVHGTSDDNVYFKHALSISEALFRAGKEHEFLPLAGFTHMVPDALVSRRLNERIMGFLRKHLGSPEAR